MKSKKLIGRRSESRAKACFRLAERGGTKKGLIPRSSAAESAEGAGAGLCPAVLIPFINDNEATGFRFTAVPDIDLWLDRTTNQDTPGTEENLDALTLIKETLLMGFRLRRGPDNAMFKQRFKKDIEEYIPCTIKKWRKAGQLEQDRTALSGDGLLLLNTFLTDAFLELESMY